MKKVWLCLILVQICACTDHFKNFAITRSRLEDKIKGGWAGQVIGCTYGGPTEFRFNQELIPDKFEIPWYDGYLAETYLVKPGLYDDIYLDLTFVQVFEKEGLDAPARSFARAMARAGYPLWHANQAARYNILNGLSPPLSGHWLNNPHAEDIDFQIEADFAGLMSPGMVNTASDICDKVGHIMNYGDGWYGGVFMAALYSFAFISDDIHWIVEEALKTIPVESLYYQTIRDVIDWFDQEPSNWKANWAKTVEKWGKDTGCPVGVLDPFTIEARINSAWIVLGLLYGNSDFGRTIEISTRCGDDSDCNPASAGGILGTILGYDAIPVEWKLGLEEVESLDFQHTALSLKDAYELGTRHALKVIQTQGGKIGGDKIKIRTQRPKPVRLEIGFEGHYPVEKRILNLEVETEASFEFDGIGFSLNGGVRDEKGESSVMSVDMYIDGQKIETVSLPSQHNLRRPTPFWRYQLFKGRHTVRFVVADPNENASLFLESAVIYSDSPFY